MSEENNGGIVEAIGYLPCLFVLPLLFGKGNKLHAQQGAVITLLWLVLLVFMVISPLFALLGVFISLGLIGVMMWGALQAFQGNLWNIPGIAGVASKLNFDGLTALFKKSDAENPTTEEAKPKSEGPAAEESSPEEHDEPEEADDAGDA